MFIKKVELHRHGKVNKKDCRQWFITGTVQELFWIQRVTFNILHITGGMRQEV